MGASRSAAVDAIRLITAASSDNITDELELVTELLEEPERAALAMMALAAMVRSLVTLIAVQRDQPCDELLARMLDTANRWPT